MTIQQLPYTETEGRILFLEYVKPRKRKIEFLRFIGATTLEAMEKAKNYLTVYKGKVKGGYSMDAKIQTYNDGKVLYTYKPYSDDRTYINLNAFN